MFRAFLFLLLVIFFCESAITGIFEATGGLGAKGRLTTATDGTATTKYQYDAFGRVTSKAQMIGSVTKTQTMNYTKHRDTQNLKAIRCNQKPYKSN